MKIRVDLICTDNHILKDVLLESWEGNLIYPPCFRKLKLQFCNAKTEQYYASRKPSEGYAVVNGANW